MGRREVTSYGRIVNIIPVYDRQHPLPVLVSAIEPGRSAEIAVPNPSEHGSARTLFLAAHVLWPVDTDATAPVYSCFGQ